MSFKNKLLIRIIVLSTFLIGNNSIAQENLKFDCTCSNGKKNSLIILKVDSKEKFNKYEITSPSEWSSIFFLKMNQYNIELAEDIYGTNSIVIISPEIKDSTFRKFKFGSIFGGGVTILDNGRAKFSGVTSHSRFFSELYYSDGSIIELNYYDGMYSHKCTKIE